MGAIFNHLDFLFNVSLGVATALGFVSAIVQFLAYRRTEIRTEEKIEQIESKAAEEPEKIRFAWDRARTKLEAYFDRNLNQVKSIFWVAIVVMVVGFAFIMYGVSRSMNDPRTLNIALISAASGLVTEFIGATFMLIYRSTMQQAASFMNVLERINTVGMAVQILDSISEEHGELKNSARAELVKILLSETRHHPEVNAALARSPRSTRIKKAAAASGGTE